jgi:sugar O-acyltransferase (sialic acid O-acetyltransferase NeuD family)
MPKKLLIFPFNGNGLEALDCLSEAYEFIGFVDDTPHKQGKHQSGFHVFSRDAFNTYKEAAVLAVPGSAVSYLMRKKYIDGLQIAAERFATVVHPNAVISSYAKLGYNVLIMAGVVVTSNAVIKNHVCILPNSVIHHDAIIGEYTLIGSQVVIAGGTFLERNCYIGSGTTIINGIHIGENSLIGLGSNILKDVAPNSKMVGNPARNIIQP